MSAQALADDIESRYGYEMKRQAIANMESGRRRAGITDLLILAAALDVSPLQLVIGDDNGDVEILPGVSAEGWTAARWWRGDADLTGTVPPADDPTRRVLSLLLMHADWVERLIVDHSKVEFAVDETQLSSIASVADDTQELRNVLAYIQFQQVENVRAVEADLQALATIRSKLAGLDVRLPSVDSHIEALLLDWIGRNHG